MHCHRNSKHDFSDMAADERAPHPDLADIFSEKNSTYSLAVGEVLNDYAPEWMEEVKWEFEFREEPRLLSEILEAEHLLFRQVWYNRHWNLRTDIEEGRHLVVPEEGYSRNPYRNDQTIDTV